MAGRTVCFVSTGQKTVQRAEGVPAAAAGAGAAAPKPGEKFTNEELCARFGVPARGGIRVGREKKCIVLVDRVDGNSTYANTDDGGTASYMGQNSDAEGIRNQEMSGNNLALSRSKEEGYTVLYFIKEGDVLAFDSCVECTSYDFVVDKKDVRRPRVVIKFKLEKVAGVPEAAGGKMESLGSPWVAGLEEDKLTTETVGEYVARMADSMEPGLCTQEDAEEIDEGLRQLAKGEYVTLDDLRSGTGSKCG